MPHLFESKDSFKESFKEAVSDAYGRDFEDTYLEERYIVLGNMIRDFAGEHWRETKNAIKKTESKQLYYFSMEFLMGRLMTSNLMNLNIYDVVIDGLKDLVFFVAYFYSLFVRYCANCSLNIVGDWLFSKIRSPCSFSITRQ